MSFSVFMLTDLLFGVLAFFGAYYLRFEGNIPAPVFSGFTVLWFWYILLKVLVFHFTGLYKRIWRFLGTNELLSLVGALFITNLLLISVSYYWHVMVPRSVFILTWLLDMAFSGGVRLLPKLYYERGKMLSNFSHGRRVLIVGAGDAGYLVVKELQRRPESELAPVGFLDDNEQKLRMKILGLPVLGKHSALGRVVKEHYIQEVLIAMPSAKGEVIREIVESCRKAKVPVRTLPRMYDIINGEITLDSIREVKLEDLLGREPVQLDTTVIADSIRHKTILVTGAGGSIGAELCRQICRFNPAELVLLGHDENPLFEIEMELREKYPQAKLRTVIADIKDAPRIEAVFMQIKPEVVFHAAAHKHVPLMEANPGEAFKNNILGTRNVAVAASKVPAESFVFISTDKAVNPTSVMGATKRIAEIMIQSFNAIGTTKFVAVRFGNVLGSRGSVVPIFQEQIRKGGPVTVTDPEMKRFFMTIPEASQLVLQAGGMAQGGEIFILDMGEPVKIVDMAKELIRLSGFEPEKDIAIEFTGIRPGEKLYEEILTAQEGVTATKHKRIFTAQKQEYNYPELERLSQRLLQRQFCTDREAVFELLHRLEAAPETSKEANECVS